MAIFSAESINRGKGEGKDEKRFEQITHARKSSTLMRLKNSFQNAKHLPSSIMF